MRLFSWQNVLLVVIFILGTLAGMALEPSPIEESFETIVIDHATGEITTLPKADVPLASGSSQKKPLLQRLLDSGPQEQASPQDWIAESDISVLSNKVIINIDNPEWARFTNTNSMDPVIDEYSHAIEIVPTSPNQIQVGDIVSYQSNIVDGTIIHRIVEIGSDKEGWYAIFRGDNNSANDPERVRFEQIRRVVVAIIY